MSFRHRDVVVKVILTLVSGEVAAGAHTANKSFERTVKRTHSEEVLTQNFKLTFIWLQLKNALCLSSQNVA